MAQETYYVVHGTDDDGESVEARFDSLRQAGSYAAALAKASRVPADVFGFWSRQCGQRRYMPDGSTHEIN